MKITERHWLLLFVVAASAICFSFLVTPNGASAISGGGNYMGNKLIPGVYDMNVIGQPTIRFHVTFFGDGIVGISQPDTDRTYATGHYNSKKQGQTTSFTIIDDHFHVADGAVEFVERHNWGGTITEDGVLAGQAEITVRDLSGKVIDQFDVDLEGQRLPEPPAP